MLKEKIEALLEKTDFDDSDRALFAEFREALRRGEIRAAERSRKASGKLIGGSKEASC